MVLTLFLFLLFAFLITRLIRRSTPGLTPLEVVMAFGFKVLMACVYGYLFLHYYGGDDTWNYNNLSMQEYKLLVSRPLRFLWELTPGTAWQNAGGNLWLTFRLYLADLEYALIVKMLGVFNIVTRGNYYANAVLFSFLTFWGHYWLYKLMAGLFPQKKRILLLLIFFFPPVVFWLSGIRADGLILLFVSLSLLHAWKWIHLQKNVSFLYMLLGLAGILILRDAMVLPLLPALLCWFIILRFHRKPLPVFGIVYGIAILLFFGSAYIPGAPNLPMAIVNRQQEFLVLNGNTRLPLDVLEPTVPGFIRVLPQAISNTFFRPSLWEANGMLQIMTAADILFFWLLLALAIIRRDKNITSISYPLLWVMLFFSIALYLFIGYVIPFPGAIVRYKVIPELFLMALIINAIRLPRFLLVEGRQ